MKTVLTYKLGTASYPPGLARRNRTHPAHASLERRAAKITQRLRSVGEKTKAENRGIFLFFMESESCLFLQCRLGCCQASDWHAEGGAGNIVYTDFVAECDTGRVAAMLAADTDFQFLVCAATTFDTQL